MEGAAESQASVDGEITAEAVESDHLGNDGVIAIAG